jgi:hypothetical protein
VRYRVTDRYSIRVNTITPGGRKKRQLALAGMQDHVASIVQFPARRQRL